MNNATVLSIVFSLKAVYSVYPKSRYILKLEDYRLRKIRGSQKKGKD